MSDLVGNPEDRFSQNEAHIIAYDINQRADNVSDATMFKSYVMC